MFGHSPEAKVFEKRKTRNGWNFASAMRILIADQNFCLDRLSTSGAYYHQNWTDDFSVRVKKINVKEGAMFMKSGLKTPNVGEVSKLLRLGCENGSCSIDSRVSTLGSHISFSILVTLSALLLNVRGVMAAAGALHDSSRWLALLYFTSTSVFVTLTFYLRGVSQRLATVGKGCRKTESASAR
jgi:hypothetical protein